MGDTRICPILKAEGVSLNNSAYQHGIGKSRLSMERRNEIKNLCIYKCPFPTSCVYEKKVKKTRSRVLQKILQ